MSAFGVAKPSATCSLLVNLLRGQADSFALSSTGLLDRSPSVFEEEGEGRRGRRARGQESLRGPAVSRWDGRDTTSARYVGRDERASVVLDRTGAMKWWPLVPDKCKDERDIWGLLGRL